MVGLGLRQLSLRLESLELDIGIGELDEHGGGGDFLARLDVLALDAARGDGGDPADLLGDERARPANLTHHLTTRDGVDPERGRIDRRSGPVEPRQRDGDENERGERASGVEIAARVGFRGTRNVQGRARRRRCATCSERLPYMEAACPGAGVPTRYVVGT